MESKTTSPPSLSAQHIAALVLLQTIAEHSRMCRDGAQCARGPALSKRLDVYTQYAFTKRGRKRFFGFAIGVMADAHPGGPEAGRRIVSRLFSRVPS